MISPLKHPLKPIEALVLCRVYCNARTIETLSEMSHRLGVSIRALSSAFKCLSEASLIVLIENTGRGKSWEVTDLGEGMVCRLLY